MKMISNSPRTDPTQLTTLRRVFKTELNQRLRMVVREVVSWINRQQSLGEHSLVTLDTLYPFCGRCVAGGQWWNKYTDKAYEKGASRAYKDVRSTHSRLRPLETRQEQLQREFVGTLKVNSSFRKILNFDPNQQRAPKGTETGGQWVKIPGGIITDKSEFKAWFGDSKVVDENGKPLVVYHGTGDDFSTFEQGKSGRDSTKDSKVAFYFSNNPDVADEWAWKSGEYIGIIKPVYLSLKNPLIADGEEFFNPRTVLDTITKAKNAGHDGVIFRNQGSLTGRSTHFAVFSPTQIKSATGNRGTFDPTDPDIRNQITNASPRSLSSRVSTELKGLSDYTSQRVIRVVQDGITAGHPKDQMIRDVTEITKKISRSRAAAIVETELTRIFSEAYLDGLEMLGITEVGVAVEWHTKDDGRVCKLCLALDGVVLKVSEARGLFPRHVRCRCRPKFLKVGRYTKGQIRSQKQIKAAIDSSVSEELPGKSLRAAKRQSQWTGTKQRIGKNRPRDTIQKARAKAKAKLASRTRANRKTGKK